MHKGACITIIGPPFVRYNLLQEPPLLSTLSEEISIGSRVIGSDCLSMAKQKVFFVGATGETGGSILKALLEDGSFVSSE